MDAGSIQEKAMRRITLLAAILAMAPAAQAQTANGAMPSMGMAMHGDHAAHMPAMAESQRQARVSERGKDVMPFSLEATRHIFTKDAGGGVQQVVVRDKANGGQILLIRQHLQAMQAQFSQGDFSGPSHIHGAQMPGLPELEAAKPGQLSIEYQEIENGARLVYRTANPRLVAAIHAWFDAQVSDHGKDAEAGHRHAKPE